ncbi:MAG: phage tail assembly chaperone [Aeromonas veronii]
MIKWDKVITVDQKQLEKEKQLRAERDRAIADTDWLVLRHAEEAAKTLSDEEYKKLLDYRQALRDWPKVAGWADNPMPGKY